MREASLERIASLLEALRANPALREAQPARFFLDDKEFVHFHDDADGIDADALLARGRVSMPVNSPAEQAEFLDRLDESLASLASRARDRRRRRHRRTT